MDTEAETVHAEEQQPEVEQQEIASTEGEQPQEEVVEQREEEKVPLSALQKERRKRQEAEKRASLFQELQEKQLREQPQAPPAEEEDLYEAVTKADLGKTEKQVMRAVEEKQWVKENPEKYLEVNDNLKEFLKLRPNLAPAIEAKSNRYEEAWMLMNALSPKQKASLKVPPAPRKDAPGSPTGGPKAAGMNQSIDLYSMSDTEFADWRKSQRKPR